MAAVSQAVPVAQPQRQNKGLPVPGPRQPGVGTKVDEEQPAPIVLQGPGVGVKVDVGQPVPVLQGQAANVPNLQLTLHGSGCSRLVYILSEMVYTSCIAISMHVHAHINDWCAHINDWWVSQIHTYHALQHYFCIIL